MMRPKPAACMARQRRVGAGQHGHQVDGEQLGPILRRRRREERVLIETGIVDENIERALLRHGLPAPRPASETSSSTADRADLTGQPGCGAPIDIADDDTGARRGKRPRDRGADSLGPAGHECATTVEPSERQGAGRLHAQRPVNKGLRRSMTAARPSRASAVPESSETVRASSGRHCSTLEPIPLHNRRLVAASAFGAPAASSRASASDAAASSVVGHDSGDDAEVQRFLGGDHRIGQQNRGRPAQPDQPRQRHRDAGIRRHADPGRAGEEFGGSPAPPRCPKHRPGRSLRHRQQNPAPM